MNVYPVPFVRPLTVHDNGPDLHEHVFASGDDVTVNPDTAEPPFDAGATQDTLT